MYIWRGVNRRDRRSQKLSGHHVWKASKRATEVDGDEALRVALETEHVTIFRDRTYKKIFNFLDTKQGQEEIRLVSLEIMKLHEEAHGEVEEGEEVVPPEMKKKKNIYEIFRKFDADGSNSMDQGELKILLDELNVTMTDEELDELWATLDEDGGGEIDFDEFYNWFVREAEAVRAKNRFSLKSAAFYAGFKRMVLEVEARNMILDHTVHHAVLAGRKEYRVAHPAKFVCDRCDKAFDSLKMLQAHNKDKVGHIPIDKEMKEKLTAFTAVERVFESKHGRQLSAMRLLFDEELGTMESRVLAAKYAPFRPFLADHGDGRSITRLRKGDMVMGQDATSGLRPAPRHLGMRRQHRAPGTKQTNDGGVRRSAAVDPLTTVLAKLTQARDLAVDTYVAPVPGAHATVRFQFNGYSVSSVHLVGEFNGWKGQLLGSDFSIGKCFINMKLAPGKYQYYYLIDDKTAVLEETCSRASGHPRGIGPAQEVNTIMIINPTGEQAAHNRKHNLLNTLSEKLEVATITEINLRNVQLADDGCWTLASHMEDNTTVMVIDVSYNGISDEGIQGLMGGIRGMHGLQELKLNGNGFAFDGVRYLTDVLKQSHVIRVLQLSLNRIADDGADLLGAMLKHHKSIEELYLDSNFIGNSGVTAIGEGLIRNKTLKILTLANNRILNYGCDQLSQAVAANGTLERLSLNDNPLGAEGSRYIGQMLYSNDTLKFLDLSSTDILRGKSAAGLHVIAYALRTNRALKHLVLRNNGLDDDHMLELAHSMHYNRGLEQFDLDGNKMRSDWLKPDTFLLTKVLRDMPSIRTSTDRNRAIYADPELSAKYAIQPHEMDDVDEGYWTHRRKWRTLNMERQRRLALKNYVGPEVGRVAMEREWIEEKMQESRDEIDAFIATKEGTRFLNVIARVIAKWYESLELDDHPTVVRQRAEQAQAAAQVSASSGSSHVAPTLANLPQDDSSSMFSGTMMDSSLASSVPGDKKRPHTKQKGGGSISSGQSVGGLDDDPQMLGDGLGLASGSLHSIRSEEASTESQRLTKMWNAKNTPPSVVGRLRDVIRHQVASLSRAAVVLSTSYREDWEDKCALAVTAVAFKQCGADEHLFIDPGYIDRVLHLLCLPCSDEEAEAAMQACVVPDIWKLGFRRFNKYLRSHGNRIAKLGGRNRQRVLADVKAHPPLEEASLLLHMCTAHERHAELVEEYRNMKDMTPEFLCTFCTMRFATEKDLDRHRRGRADHIRYMQRLQLWESQRVLLRRAKTILTGTEFPCYYELMDTRFLPSSHAPQIFDVRGEDGRPVGIIKDDVLVRVEDVLGDWIKIRHAGKYAWCRFRINIRGLDIKVMAPGMRSVMSIGGGGDKFWKDLRMWDQPRFFEMGRNLEPHAEIKVRIRPAKGARICGHLAKGTVVKVWAVFGHWLQVEYEEYSVAWCLWRVKNSLLVEGMKVNCLREVATGVNDGDVMQKYFRGVLVKRKENNRWDVDYDDGIQEKDVPRRLIQGLEYTVLLNKLPQALNIRFRNTLRESPWIPAENELEALKEEVFQEQEEAISVPAGADGEVGSGSLGRAAEDDGGVDEREMMPSHMYEGGDGDGSKGEGEV